MYLLIVGGSEKHLGGVEGFCDRATDSLRDVEPGWRIERLATETAYLRINRIPVVLSQIGILIGLRRDKPDLAWVQYVNLPDLLYVIVAKVIGIRVMLTPHLGSNWRSQKNSALRRMSSFLMGRADQIALLSNTQEREILLPADTPRVMLRSFLPALILRGPLAKTINTHPRLRLLHAARLSVEKGTFQTVEVARHLRFAGVSFKLDIAGGADPATFARLNALVAQYELQDCISILGRMEGDQMLDLLHRSDVLVHLSSIDSYPLILLEAMACGTFPIAMDLAGARDMIEHYDGVIVSPENPVAETVAWLKSADLLNLRQRALGQSMRVRADYDWDHCARTLSAALQKCVSIGI